MILQKIKNDTIGEIVSEDVNLILDKCKKIAHNEIVEQKDAASFHDMVCPNCRNKGNVVDKIKNVEGVANIVNNFWGEDKFKLKIHTYSVNHCNGCGHEWKKFKETPINKNQILRLAFRYLALDIKNEFNYHESSTRREVLDVFENAHAESIYKLYKEHSKNLQSEVKSTIKLSTLKGLYPTIN